MRRVVVFLLCFIPVLAFSQFKTQAEDVDISTALRSGAGAATGLVNVLGLDPSRFNMTHSYSMSYMSLGGHGMTQGLYLNTMSYEFAFPMMVQLQLGMAHQPFATNENVPLMNSGPFISSALVQYKPFKNTLIQFEYSQNPYSMNSRFYRNSNFDW